MAASSIAAFWVVSSLLIMVPGADWAYTIGAGLRGHPVLAAVGGIVLGYAAMTIVVAAGVGALVARSPALLAALTIVGGLYLMWHGATTMARPSAQSAPASNGEAANRSAPARTGQATLLRGVGVSALNPKGLLLFLALLPAVHQPGWTLAARRPARRARGGLHAQLRGLLPLRGVGRTEDPARPAGRGPRRHPVLGRRHVHHRRPPARGPPDRTMRRPLNRRL
jgi:threonine/homoserine/homoserine lactone efflux protein